MHIYCILYLVEEATWQAVVLIPKGKKDYRGIGLVEVMWKVVAAILNRRFTDSITYHDFLRRFRAGCGTGTATLEAKILQQLAALKEEVLYVIFLDLHKAYDALYRSRCLEILEGYGFSPKSRRFLTNYWCRLTMVARAEGYYRTAFRGERGVTQGDRVHYHIEDGGGQQVALCHASLPSERCPVVAPCSSHHGQAAPVIS